MTFPTNYISLHLIKVVSAEALNATGNPVQISIKGHINDTQVTLFVSSPEYAHRLAVAINDAVNADQDEADLQAYADKLAKIVQDMK